MDNHEREHVVMRVAAFLRRFTDAEREAALNRMDTDFAVEVRAYLDRGPTGSVANAVTRT